MNEKNNKNKIKNHDIVLVCSCEKYRKKQDDFQEQIKKELKETQSHTERKFQQLREQLGAELRDVSSHVSLEIKKMNEKTYDTMASRIYEWFEARGWLRRPE